MVKCLLHEHEVVYTILRTHIKNKKQMELNISIVPKLGETEKDGFLGLESQKERERERERESLTKKGGDRLKKIPNIQTSISGLYK